MATPKPNWVIKQIYIDDNNELNYKNSDPEEIIFISETWSVKGDFLCTACHHCCVVKEDLEVFTLPKNCIIYNEQKINK